MTTPFFSMPYAQQHYPFENKDIFEKNFPADFVSEGIDQTRGWFYTLLVLSTHLFGKAPWKNLIVTGLVLAALVLIGGRQIIMWCSQLFVEMERR